MFLSFQQVTADNTIKNVTALTLPIGCTGAQIMAADNDIRYTMDGSTNPSTTEGMILMKGDWPKMFAIKDIRNIRFTRGTASNGTLLVHFYGQTQATINH